MRQYDAALACSVRVSRDYSTVRSRKGNSFLRAPRRRKKQRNNDRGQGGSHTGSVQRTKGRHAETDHQQVLAVGQFPIIRGKINSASTPKKDYWTCRSGRLSFDV